MTDNEIIIAELQRKNEELEIKLQAMRGVANNYKAQNNTLLDLQKPLLMKAEKAKSEAIKEFAERLKAQFELRPSYHRLTLIVCDEVRNAIDNLVKEMVGDESCPGN